MKPTVQDIRNLFRMAVQEDCPGKDVTSESVVPEGDISSFRIIAKERIISCGAALAEASFKSLSSKFIFRHVSRDGIWLKKNDLFLSGKGPTKAILEAERSVLNIFQRLCGIATQTRSYVDAVKGTGTIILDTRKTAPGMRRFEKYAVMTGGGTNHRFGLSDMVLLKENHLAIEARKGDGYIFRAVRKCRKKYPKLKIEVEIQKFTQAEEACESGADIILLDNMSCEEIKETVKIIRKRAKIEVSGGITLNNIRSYALPGVDYISVGALTHSFKSADLSLLIARD
ncbi:MAG: carboxylating nicotinate-nucleotide diphosphorylase [Candidatus Aureabacteria bacterium]|nr:carboxylating nicotinate-nucleotide diphosphorylase [Candidatus Auribacterota bacterium]